MNLIDHASENLTEYDIFSRSLTHSEEQQALVCERSKHLSFSKVCDACCVPLAPGDKVVFVYTTEWPMGPWSICWSSYRVQGYNRRGSVTQVDGLCFCNGPHSDLLGCVVLHSRCSNLILGRNPSQEMINRLGTDLTWRTSSSLWFISNCHSRIDFPEPQGFDSNAITIAAIAAGMPMLGQLPPELVVAIQSHCPDRPFWRLVRIHALKLRLERLSDDGEQSETHLSALVSWKRGDITPLYSTVLSNTERLRITVDSDGIYEIKRLSEHLHPNRLLKRHSERYIIANAGQLKSIRAFFKDGLCWPLCTIDHPGFTIWDTSAPPQALELSPTTSSGRQNFPRIIGFNECDMVPDFIPRNFSIETIDITASHITGISFRFYTLYDWQKFDVFVHTENDKPSSHAKRDMLVFMPLPANDEILWLQLRTNRYASRLMVETKLSGVIHLGSQDNANSVVKAFSQRPQLMLYNDDLCEDNFHWPIAFYPKGAPNDPQALRIITGPRLRHHPASTHLLWSWAPLEHIDIVSVYDEQNRNFQGMHIVYKNGGERFVGINQYLSHSTASSYCKDPTHLNVEITARGLIHTMVYFAPTDLKPLPDTEHMQYPLTGELHCWITPLARAEIRVLPSGSWRRSDVWD